jgi:hypothetical protein
MIRDVTSNSRGYIGATVVQYAGVVTGNTEPCKGASFGVIIIIIECNHFNSKRTWSVCC